MVFSHVAPARASFGTACETPTLGSNPTLSANNEDFTLFINVLLEGNDLLCTPLYTAECARALMFAGVRLRNLHAKGETLF